MPLRTIDPHLTPPWRGIDSAMKKIIQNLRENWITYGFETLVVIVGILNLENDRLVWIRLLPSLEGLGVGYR